MEAGETAEQAVLREVKEETGLDVEIIQKIGDYHEVGVQDGIKYDYSPTCYLVKPVGGHLVRQEEEIEELKLFDPPDIPLPLAFEHTYMIKDYLQLLEITRVSEDIQRCVKCQLHMTRLNAVPGEGPCNARILICGQAPGRTEDAQGRPFVGRAGHVLDELLDSIHLRRDEVFITSSVKCFPPRNRLPKPDEVRTCAPYLEAQLKIIAPQMIIALGNVALHTLLGSNVTISSSHGKPLQRHGVTIFPTFHPAAALRFSRIRALMEADFKQLEKQIPRGLIL